MLLVCMCCCHRVTDAVWLHLPSLEYSLAAMFTALSVAIYDACRKWLHACTKVKILAADQLGVVKLVFRVRVRT